MQPLERNDVEREGTTPSGINQKEKDKYQMIFTHMWVLRNKTGEHRGKKNKQEREANRKSDI